VAAFVAAAKLGADGIELDVHRTSDGVVVVHHDADLPAIGRIAELMSHELPEWLPSLVEALDACWPVKVNVEVKQHEDDAGAELDDDLALEVARILAGRAEGHGFVVSSFSLPVIDVVRRAAPNLSTALLVDSASDPYLALATARAHGHGGVHPFFAFVDEALVRAAKASGMALRAWTVDDPTRIAVLSEIGVDAVITNDVQAARRALGRAAIVTRSEHS